MPDACKDLPVHERYLRQVGRLSWFFAFVCTSFITYESKHFSKENKVNIWSRPCPFSCIPPPPPSLSSFLQALLLLDSYMAELEYDAHEREPLMIPRRQIIAFLVEPQYDHPLYDTAMRAFGLPQKKKIEEAWRRGR